jgi:hypothetical protein
VNNFGELDPREALRLVVPSATALIISFQTSFAALFISILGIRRTKETPADVAASVVEEAAEAVTRAPGRAAEDVEDADAAAEPAPASAEAAKQ